MYHLINLLNSIKQLFVSFLSKAIGALGNKITISILSFFMGCIISLFVKDAKKQKEIAALTHTYETKALSDNTRHQELDATIQRLNRDIERLNKDLGAANFTTQAGWDAKKEADTKNNSQAAANLLLENQVKTQQSTILDLQDQIKLQHPQTVEQSTQTTTESI